MSPDRDVRLGGEEPDLDPYDDEAPRSIFSALWFRALLAVLVLGVLAAVAVPYVLDFATTPALKPKPPTGTPALTSPAPAPAPSPGAAPVTSAVTGAPVSTPPETATPAPVKPATPPPAAAKARPVVAKAVEAPKSAPKAPAAKPAPAKAAAPSAAGPYWVQVGAFKDAGTAKRMAARLREQGLAVSESTATVAASRPVAAPAPVTSTPGDLYDVLVSGAPAVDIEAKLTPKGFTAQSAANGVLVRPSLALRDAVALSRELSDGGLSVQVRRVSGPASPPPPSAATPAAGDTGGAATLHRVRVGGFADRATAVAAMKQLEEKGYTPFIARGE